MRLAIYALVLLLALVAAPPRAFAQVSDEARAAFDEAERQYQAGNHQLALEGFQQVRELMSGNTRGQTLIGYNIAKCYDRLGRAADALREYEQYLADAPSDAPYRAETLDRVRDLRGRVAAEAANEPPRAQPQASPDSPLVPTGIAVTSVGAALLLAAIPTGALALDNEAQLAATCVDGRCPQSAQSVLDETYLLGTLTDIFWVAGLSVAAVGAALALAGIMTNSDTSGDAAGAAACTEEGCVATLRTRF